jgi:hypothetical protein
LAKTRSEQSSRALPDEGWLLLNKTTELQNQKCSTETACKTLKNARGKFLLGTASNIQNPACSFDT